ncbi:MAG: GtrA family protein, partial [Oscillospiraceae bacterium]
MADNKKTQIAASQRDEIENKRLSVIISRILPFTRYFFEKLPWLAQFVDFSMVGAINAVLSYVLYALCIKLGLHHQIANQISYWISVLNGYILNKHWVFANQSNKLSHTESIKYFTLYAFNFFLGIFLLWLYVD